MPQSADNSMYAVRISPNHHIFAIVHSLHKRNFLPRAIIPADKIFDYLSLSASAPRSD
jgi:hypothetical protein